MSLALRLAAALVVAFVAVAPASRAVAQTRSGPVDVTLTSPYRFYVGGGVSVVHHTGYMPYSPFNSEEWVPGTKVFGGYKITDWLLVEGAWHYLGTARFFESPGVRARETSNSLSATLLYYSPPVSSWLFDTPLPVHVLVRGGLAFKDIYQTSVVQTNEEGILAFVVGAGLEVEFSKRWFGRLEYEFVSTAIGGPGQNVPTLKGLFNLNIGGTRRVINLMTTPISLSVGYRF